MERKRERERERQTDRERERKRERERQRKTERDRQRDRQGDRQRERQRDRDRHIETETEKRSKWCCVELDPTREAAVRPTHATTCATSHMSLRVAYHRHTPPPAHTNQYVNARTTLQ